MCDLETKFTFSESDFNAKQTNKVKTAASAPFFKVFTKQYLQLRTGKGHKGMIINYGAHYSRLSDKFRSTTSLSQYKDERIYHL